MCDSEMCTPFGEGAELKYFTTANIRCNSTPHLLTAIRPFANDGNKIRVVIVVIEHFVVVET